MGRPISSWVAEAVKKLSYCWSCRVRRPPDRWLRTESPCSPMMRLHLLPEQLRVTRGRGPHTALGSSPTCFLTLGATAALPASFGLWSRASWVAHGDDFLCQHLVSGKAPRLRAGVGRGQEPRACSLRADSVFGRGRAAVCRCVPAQMRFRLASPEPPRASPPRAMAPTRGRSVAGALERGPGALETQ